jgi:hypothetical protein
MIPLKTILFLAADYANTTPDGKLNVMGVFNQIYSHSFPTRHSSMFLVIKLGAELGEYGQTRDISIRLYDPDGTSLIDQSGQVQIPQPEKGIKPEINLILELKDVIFPIPGPYQFVIFIDGDHKGDLTVHVNPTSNTLMAE